MQTGLHCEEWEPVEEHATRPYQTWGFLDALACTEIHFVPGSSKMNLTHTHTHTHTNFASESSFAVWQLHKKSDLQHLLKNVWARNAKIATDFTMRTMASDPAKKRWSEEPVLAVIDPLFLRAQCFLSRNKLVNEMLANHERIREWHKDIGSTYSCVHRRKWLTDRKRGETLQCAIKIRVSEVEASAAMFEACSMLSPNHICISC